MKLSKLITFSLLIAFSASATEETQEEVQVNLAPPSLVLNYHEYCSEIRPDNEEANEYILGCVNEQLSDSGYDKFATYSALISHMKKEDE